MRLFLGLMFGVNGECVAAGLLFDDSIPVIIGATTAAFLLYMAIAGDRP